LESMSMEIDVTIKKETEMTERLLKAIEAEK
jgi:hypothetical protein